VRSLAADGPALRPPAKKSARPQTRKRKEVGHLPVSDLSG
jgi:hypothetical protein